MRLHNKIMYNMIIIIVIVTWLTVVILVRFNKNKIVYKYENHSTPLEIVWTIVPGIILIILAIPSFKLLYLMDEIIEPLITIKIIG